MIKMDQEVINDKKKLLPIKPYVAELKKAYKERVSALQQAPRLAIIQVGNNEASNRYIKNKKKDCEEVGVIAEWYWYPEDITEDGLIQEMKDLMDFCDGMIVQMPLPATIRESEIIRAIDPEKDVDGFHPLSDYRPATPAGIMDYLAYCDINLDGADVLIIGRSNIVGKPLARLMTEANATVTLAHSHTQHLGSKELSVDLIVSAVGKADFLNCYPIHVPVIDVGINFNEEGKMVGDCINTENRDVSPVPGGVGLLTRCALLDNVITAREKNELRSKWAGCRNY